MIKENTISVNITSVNRNHYIKLGYSVNIFEKLDINVYDLPLSSHVTITAICKICSSENYIQYGKYIKNKNNHGFYSCKKCSRQKAVITSQKIYGVNNWMELKEAKEIMAKKFTNKYGVKTNLLLESNKELRKNIMEEKYGTSNFWELRNNINNEFVNSGSIKFINLNITSSKNDIKNPKLRYSDEEIKKFYDQYLIEFSNYRKEVRKLTKRVKNKLYEKWDGYDFYDREYIKDYLNLNYDNKKYPTIDHKISIYEGFYKKIKPEEISCINNLCITKRSLNSSKRNKNFEEFKERIN